MVSGLKRTGADGRRIANCGYAEELAAQQRLASATIAGASQD